MSHSKRQELDSDRTRRIADRLHSAAIRVLRRLRLQDEASGLTAPRLSALSVIVYGGPIGITQLARAEQVKPPTISRLVRGLEKEGWVRRKSDPGDRRRQLLEATPHGRRLLEEGRRRRVAQLQQEISRLTTSEAEILEQALAILEALKPPIETP